MPLNENGILIKIVRFVDHLNNFDCVITFIVGIMCGCFNIIYYYQRNIGYKRWLLCIISIFVAYYTRLVFSNSPKSTNVDFIVVPLLILPLMTLFYNTKIGTVLQYFAKHSTNIWLTHTFWCYYFGQQIVLLPKYSILIYLWLLILSLLSSYIINLLYIPINNLLFNKLHKLSYKGYFYKNI